MLSRLHTLLRQGYLVLMDSTYKSNQLSWKLFTLMIQNEHGSWIPGAHMVSDNEDGDIVAVFLQQIKTWCRKSWQLGYIITDDSDDEQRAVKLTFPGLIERELEISHFLCRTHSEQTMNRTLAGDACAEARSHLYRALYYRKTAMGCEDSINSAINAAPPSKRAYLQREWLYNKKLWATYARQHSCVLLQNMTVESWHSSLKTHAEGNLI